LVPVANCLRKASNLGNHKGEEAVSRIVISSVWFVGEDLRKRKSTWFWR